jgi:hypothetical protein
MDIAAKEARDKVIHEKWIAAIGEETFNRVSKSMIDGAWLEKRFIGQVLKDRGTDFDSKYMRDLFEWKTITGATIYGEGPVLIFRPNSLKDIEINNGWNRIDTIEDLPTDETKKYCLGFIDDNGEFQDTDSTLTIDQVLYLYERHDKAYSHYFVIDKQKPFY